MNFSEDGFDRATVLDPSWEKQQKRAFTEWCNSHLKKLNLKIESFDKDFMNGLLLIKLLEVISNERLPRPETRSMRFHKIANVNIGLAFIESKGVKLVSIGAEEIVDGNIKMTLGMIWTIILRFAIQDIQIEERSAKEGLLLWCQRKTAGYREVDVRNFHSSFNDGMAFGALIHRHRPELIDIKKYSRMHPRRNLNDAFAVAEQHLDIPKMLDADDLLRPGRTDEHSVMAYVSTFYHKFTAENQATKAAETIHLALKVNQENQNMMEDYDNLSTRLLDWIKKTVKWLNSRPDEHSLAKAHEILGAYHNYSLMEKPSFYSERIELENMYNTLQTRLKLSGRPYFVAKEGQHISEIEKEWGKLDLAEVGFEEWIFDLIETLKFLSHLLNKFYKRCSAYEIWLNDKLSELPKVDLSTLKLGDIKPMLNMVITVKDSLQRDDPETDPLRDINEMSDFFRQQNYYDMPNIEKRLKEVVDGHMNVFQIAESSIEKLEKAHSILNKVDGLLLDYAGRVTAFKKWLDSVNDDMEDTHIINNEMEANQLLMSHKEFENTLPSAETRLNQIIELVMEIRSACEGTGLPEMKETVYSVVSLDSVMAAWKKMNKLTGETLAGLEKEVANQKYIQGVKEELRNLSVEVNEWIKKMNDEIKKVQTINSDSLDAELSFLVKYEQMVAGFEPKLALLENSYQKVVEAKVFDTRNLGYSVQKLKIDYEKLRSYISAEYREIEKQKLARQASTVHSQEDIADYQTSFAHFDRDNDHKLDPEEFRSCLISLGYDTAIVENDKSFYELMKRIDKGRTGFITFEKYLNFMAEINQSHETVGNLSSCFKILANGKPYILEKELRDNLSQEQAEYCIKNMTPYNGVCGDKNPLDYETFSSSLFGGSSDM